jgi:hypothetical protein
MSDERQKRRRGGQPKDPEQRKRNNLTFRVRDQLKAALEAAATASGRSVSEEVEFRVTRDLAAEGARTDATKTLAKAAAVLSAAYGQALRGAGLQILREIEGKPTRAIVDLETLLAEADGIARGMRSGFVDPDLPAVEAPRRMTPEQEQRLLDELQAIKRQLDAAVDRTLAADAAASTDDEAA